VPFSWRKRGMMFRDPSPPPQLPPTRLSVACDHNPLMGEILREAARNRSLPGAIVESDLHREFGVVTSATAPEVGQSFSMKLCLLREALVIVEERISSLGEEEELRALLKVLQDEILSLPNRIADVHDPVAVLRTLHTVPHIRVAPEFISAILGIRDERVGGDVERYSDEQLKAEYAKGGFMYQPSEIVDIWPLFEHLSFAPGAVFYDLGSGYGHAILYGAALRPDLSFRGIELMSCRVTECQFVASRLGMANVAFKAGDLSQGGFSDADILFLFNPFPPDTEGEVRREIAQLAEVKPIVILDYRGLVTQSIPSVRAVPFMKVAPYSLAVSRRFYEESCALAGLPTRGRSERGASR